MILDTVAPNPPFVLSRSLMVEADADTTMEALLTADLMGGSIVRLLTWARDLPNRLMARVRRQPVSRVPREVTFGDLPDSGTFKVLGTKQGDQYVAGAIGRFWQRDYGWVDFDPEGFADFDEPGYAKTVIGFHAVPRGTGRTLLTYESRTVTTDDEAHRRFKRYWTVLQPFVAMMQCSALRSIAREAEASSRSEEAEVIALHRDVPTSPAMTRVAR